MEEVDMVHAVARHGSSPPFGRRRQMRQQHHVEKFLARIVFDEMLTREIESWNIHSLRHHWLWWGCNLHLMDNQQVQGASLVSFASILKMFDKMPQLTSAASKARMQKDDHPFPGFFYLGASLQPCRPLYLRLVDSGRPWDKEEAVAAVAQ
ncbi:uncharacterized protein [Setaria viridis]|uniref:uncharacterized protein isoform X4 n=1 Tax=Setaria viridis TaxID=4556 RepID=UPI003B3A5289